MLKEAQLKKMSMKDLMTLQGRVESAIATRKEQDKEAVKEKMEKLARESGYNIVELFGNKTVKKRAPVAVKYRDPKNLGDTWTGRGRMPRWLSAKVRPVKNAKNFLSKNNCVKSLIYQFVEPAVRSRRFICIFVANTGCGQYFCFWEPALTAKM